MIERIKNPKSAPTMYSGVHHTYGVSESPFLRLKKGSKNWASNFGPVGPQTGPVSVHVTRRGKSTGTPFSGLAVGAKTPRP